MNKLFINNKLFDNILVAVSYNEQAQGLMFKEWPPPIMAFPYKKSMLRKFWMKNTISPLDVIFCNNNKIIDIFKGQPLSTVSFGPNIPSDLVVELPYGTCNKLGFKVGDSIKIEYCIDTLIKINKLGV